MRAPAALLAIAALAVPSAGHGKGPTIEGLRFCGSSGCRDVTDKGVVRLLLPVAWNGTPRGPAAPGPYYSMRLLDDRRRPVDSHGLGLSTLFFVPGAGALRTGGAIAKWRRLGPYASDFRRATQRMRPFTRPRLVKVEVDGRAAKEPRSYLQLYEVRGRFAHDPAGLHPHILGDYSAGAVGQYYQRVVRHWIPVNLWSSAPSPWGDGANFVWVSRRGSLLKRDGEVLQISAGLAKRVRRGTSLRGL
jgi:hypothetical protein